MKQIHIKVNELLHNIGKENITILPVFIPHYGCIHECIFCNQKKITGKNDVSHLEQIDKYISDYLKNIKDKSNIQIAFFGGTFTAININSQIKLLEIANKYIKNGLVKSIRISTRPDNIDVNNLKILKKYNVEVIELGVQSMDNKVLDLNKRGHNNLDVIRASKLIKMFNIKLGFQIMIGMYGANKQNEINTMKSLLKLKAEYLRIYPVYVLDGSLLYKLYKSSTYNPLTLEEAVERSYNVVKLCLNSNIKIIRLGLQSTDEITSNNVEVAGPVCDNFAEHVYSKIVLDEIIKSINLIENIKELDEIIEIIVPEKYISITVGPKRCNIKYIKNKYNINMKVKGE